MLRCRRPRMKKIIASLRGVRRTHRPDHLMVTSLAFIRARDPTRKTGIDFLCRLQAAHGRVFFAAAGPESVGGQMYLPVLFPPNDDEKSGRPVFGITFLVAPIR